MMGPVEQLKRHSFQNRKKEEALAAFTTTKSISNCSSDVLDTEVYSFKFSQANIGAKTIEEKFSRVI